jgi:hypothetical protein
MFELRIKNDGKLYFKIKNDGKTFEIEIDAEDLVRLYSLSGNGLRCIYDKLPKGESLEGRKDLKESEGRKEPEGIDLTEDTESIREIVKEIMSDENVKMKTFLHSSS